MQRLQTLCLQVWETFAATKQKTAERSAFALQNAHWRQVSCTTEATTSWPTRQCCHAYEHRVRPRWTQTPVIAELAMVCFSSRELREIRSLIIVQEHSQTRSVYKIPHIKHFLAVTVVWANSLLKLYPEGVWSKVWPNPNASHWILNLTDWSRKLGTGACAFLNSNLMFCASRTFKAGCRRSFATPDWPTCHNRL